MHGGRPRSGGPDWRRVLALGGITVLVAAVLMAGTYAGLLWYRLNDINTLDISSAPTFDQVVPPGEDGGGVQPGEPYTPPPDSEVERTTILVVGSDTREGLTPEQLQAIGTEETGTNFTDTIILVQIDPATDAAAMLSFPRDLVLHRCDGSYGRINQAYAIGEEQFEGGGPACLTRTIERFTGIRIDHFVRVSLAGFVDVVDAIDGVTFYVDQPLHDAYAGLDIPEAGCVHFDGIRALQFVRARRELDNAGDFGRIARQQRFLKEVLNKATSLGVLLRPDRVTSLINSISGTLETDTGFTPGVMIDLLTSMQNLTAGAVDVRTVPGVAVEGPQGAAWVEPIEEEAGQLFRAFARGDLLPENIGTDGVPEELGPANVLPVVVLNGSSEPDAAEEAAEALELLGFTVAETGDRENYGFEGSTILYPPEREAHAELLADALGGGITTTETSGTEDASRLTLIIGDGFDVADLDLPTPDPDAGETASEEPSEAPSNPDDLSEREAAGAEVSDVQC